MFRAAVIALLMIVTTPAALRAQTGPQPQQPVEEERMVTRTYDLTDLFRAPRNYPLPQSMVPATRLPGEEPLRGGGQSLFGGMEGEKSAAPSLFPQPVTAESIGQLLMGTIAPQSWRDAGGSLGSLRFIGARLVVSQTADNQKQIEDLLNIIRDEAGTAYMVSVQAQWIQFTPDDLRAITGKPSDATGAALKEVPDGLLTDAKVYARGQTLGYNGQTVHVASGRANTVITGMEPVVGTQAIGYSLQTVTVQSGVALQVTPQVLSDGKLISLDLHSIVSEIDDTAPLPDPRALDTDGPTTEPIEQTLGQRARIIAQQFSTTARIPVGKRVLIGGMTFDPGANAETGKQLYLVIEANAIK